MIYFKKMINNNVALVETKRGNEYIVIGKGIAFQKQAGDIIDESKIEKHYSLSEKENEMLVDYLKDVDYQIFVIADRVKKLVEETCDIEYSQYMYMSLVDHINGSITRMKMGISVDSEINEEQLFYYKREYELAQKTNKIIEEELGITFDKNEINILIMHYISFLYDLKYTQLNNKVLIITNEILKFVEDEIGEDNMNSFAVDRFVVHLKFFITRQYYKENKVDEVTEYNQELYSLLTSQHPSAEKLLLKIIRYLEETSNFSVSLDEWLYLLIHIIKIIK